MQLDDYGVVIFVPTRLDKSDFWVVSGLYLRYRVNESLSFIFILTSRDREGSRVFPKMLDTIGCLLTSMPMSRAQLV